MKSNKAKPKQGSQNRLILVVFFLVGTLMISSAIIELQQSKKELLHLMTKQAHSLLESLIIASQNTLRTTSYLDDLAEQRLLNNATLIKRMYDENRIRNQILTEISQQNNIYRINIFNKRGQKIYSSYTPTEHSLPEQNNPGITLQPIFSGEKDTLLIGYKKARFNSGHRFAVALAAKNRSAIVLNFDAREMLAFKRDIDFGALIQKVVRENSQIIYIALQDQENILAASGNITELDGIQQSLFLQNAFEDSTFSTRTAIFNKSEVFEAVHPLSNAGVTIGLFRIGISLEPIQEINDRLLRRMIIITIILIVIGFILFIYIFTRKRLNILQNEYDVVETYSGSIIDNVSDTIILLDNRNGIKIFNRAAEKLFEREKQEVLGQNLSLIFSQPECLNLLGSESLLREMSCKISNKQKELLTSKSSFWDNDGIENSILVIRDLTTQKQMQAQLERQQRLTAMGKLASGVAHEIRNPLNTIGTIVQQLDKDFEPATEKDEYHELAGLVYKEVKRINETVQDFLRFSRPEPIQPKQIQIEELFKHIDRQFRPLMELKQINFTVQVKWQGEVYWDEKQIKQVFINIIQNAMDAIENDGQILILVNAKNEQAHIRITDNGSGMTEDTRANIFNLYFTTKAKGTGIGLSIVQRIIYEHGGVISVESDPGTGSTFIIKLPFRVSKQ